MKMTATEKVILSQPEDKLLFANNLFLKVRGRVSKDAYHKTLSRMVSYGSLRRFGKGIYYRPQKTRFGLLPITHKEVENFYATAERGMLIGYKMYNRYGLTTQITKQTEILSTVTDYEKQSLGNYFLVMKIRSQLTPAVKKCIEMLEILQNARQIEDLNYPSLRKFIQNFVQCYDNDSMEQVLLTRRYKRATIASVASMLDYWQVAHTLQRHISKNSRYKTLMAEELYETAHR